jgi:transcriptional regulator with XRE-family HTH domain
MKGMFANIGKALALLRQERGVSQKELAHRCQIGRARISNFETGKEIMRLDTLEKVLRSLAVEPSQFYGLVMSLDSSLKLVTAGPGEPEGRMLEDAFLNLHAAIDKLQKAVDQAFASRSPGPAAAAPPPAPPIGGAGGGEGQL